MRIIRPGDTIRKDPDAVRFYGMRWADWLENGATIADSEWFIYDENGNASDGILTKDHEDLALSNTAAKVQLSGGTPGAKYKLTNHITTNESPAQADDRSVFIEIRDR